MSTTKPLEMVNNDSNKNDSSISLQNKSTPDTTKHTGSFVDTIDLVHFLKTARFSRDACQSMVTDRKNLSEGLLRDVFNGESKKVAEFFADGSAKVETILAKTCYSEEFMERRKDKESHKVTEKLVCSRRLRSVSPLQAAALCGDNFMVIKLLSYLEKDEKLRLEAAKQLQDVLNRKLKGDLVSKTNEKQSRTSGEETKVSKEADLLSNKEINYADEDDYLAPFKKLIKAYDAFFIQFDKQYQYHFCEMRWMYDTWDAWYSVVSAQERLSSYGLHEFYDKKSFGPLPKFDVEPQREKPKLKDERSAFAGLYKGQNNEGYKVAYMGLGDLIGPARIDAAAIRELCKVRTMELEKIIQCLLSPGGELTLDVNKEKLRNQN